MSRLARVLQLSDFHFVARLTQKGRAWYSRPFLWAKAKPHSFTKLVALARRIESIERQRGKFDIVLATGDLATDGSEEAFATFHSFFSQQEIRGGDPSRVITRGLGVENQRGIMLPGNHDRFTRSWCGVQTNSTVFEEVFKTPRVYPYVVGYRRTDERNVPEEPAILFFVFDSTPPVFAKVWPWWYRVARGRLGPGDCDALLDQARQLIQTGTVRAMDGTVLNISYSNCIRVVVLHHHPLDQARTSLMEGSDEFIRYCLMIGIHLILFGHDHKEFWATRFGQSQLTNDPNHKMTLFCCPSASEYASINGFYTFEFDNDSFQFRLYQWDNVGSFVPGTLDENNRFFRHCVHRIPFS